MTQTEVLRLALEFFETMQRYKGVRSKIFIRFEPTATGDYLNLQEFDERAKPVITAIKAALEAKDEKDGSPCPEFWDWLPKAYRNGDADDLPKFTKYNMEVAFLAGKQSAALEAKDEPVAFASHGVVNWIADKQFMHEAELYIVSPQRKPLTDEEIVLIVAECAASHQHTDIHFARAIEAKLKEKNK